MLTLRQSGIRTTKWLETKEAFPSASPPSLLPSPSLFCESASSSLSVNQLSLLLPPLDRRWPLSYSSHQMTNNRLTGENFQSMGGFGLCRCWKNYSLQSLAAQWHLLHLKMNCVSPIPLCIARSDDDDNNGRYPLYYSAYYMPGSGASTSHTYLLNFHNNSIKKLRHREIK